MSERTYLYLLRHGATDANQRRPYVLQGQGTDGPLSQAGRTQARRAAEALAHLPIHTVFASPLKRSRETAAIVAEPHGAQVRVVPEITEVDVGEWEAMSWNAVMERYPEQYRRFMSDPAVFPYAGGESYADVARRVVPALEAILREHDGHVAVVGHNVVNRVFLAHLLGVELRRARTLRQSNCGINVIRRKGDEIELITLNGVLHLESE